MAHEQGMVMVKITHRQEKRRLPSEETGKLFFYHLAPDGAFQG